MKTLMALKTCVVAAVAAIGIGARAAALPAEYQEVEYVESSGSQWIDTKVTITQDHELRFKYAMLAVDAYKGPFGTYTSEDHNATRVMANNGSATTLLVNFMTKAGGGSTTFNNVTTKTGDVVEGWMNYNCASFNGVEQNLSHNSIGTADTSTLKLLGRSGYATSIRMYYFRILEKGVVTHEYVPCYRKSDPSQIGFYDTVGNAALLTTGLTCGKDVSGEGEDEPVCPATLDASCYVQDGLVTHWDAVDNIGYGQHDSSATTWKDLAGSIDLAIVNGKGVWDNSWLRVSSGAAYAEGKKVPLYQTLEMTFRTTSAKKGIMFNSGIATSSTDAHWGALNNSGPIYFDAGHSTYYYTDKVNVDQRLSVAWNEGNTAVANIYSNAVDVTDAKKKYTETWGNRPRVMIGERDLNSTSYPWYGRMYAIRLYNRPLTESERAWNARLDGIRFLGESSDDVLYVASSMPGVGACSPAYGVQMDLASGAQQPLTAEASWTAADGSVKATCAGWKLYDLDGNEVGSDTSNACDYKHPGAFRKLVWQWNVQYAMAATTNGAGTVSVSSAWVAGGDNAVFTATPAEGFSFVQWVDANGTVVSKANPYTVQPMEALSLTAVFRKYTPLEYLESTGAQYINTGVIPAAGMSAEIDAQATTRTDGHYFFGSYSKENGASGLLYGEGNDKNRPRLGYAGNDNVINGYNNVAGVDFTTRHTLTLGSTSVRYNGDKIFSYAEKTIAGATQPIYLFARNWQGGVNGQCKAKIFSFRLWKGDEIACDYIPVAEYDSETGVTRYGMLDGATGEFMVNKGTGAGFTPGPEAASTIYRINHNGERLTVEYPVNAAVSGAGTVAQSETWAPCGSNVVFTATAADGESFLGWGGAASGTDATVSAVCRGALSVSAAFTGGSALVCEWTGLGNDEKASNPANWKNGCVPGFGAKVLLDGGETDAAQKAITWDIASPVAEWTQDGYTNVVTVTTTYPAYDTAYTNFVVTGDMTVNSGVITHKDNYGLSERFRLYLTVGGNLTVGTNATTGAFGRIDVHGRGYNRNPGYSDGDRGGSYGGSTADNVYKCYGSIKNPEQGGSGGNGGNDRLSNGGGAVYVNCAGNIVVDGAINADGTAIDIWNGKVGCRKGSGGGVILKAKSSISGAGLVSARAAQGGDSHSPGGGGRMAFYLTDSAATHEDFTVNVSVRQSTVNLGAAGGTIYYEVPGDEKRGVLYVESGSGDADTNYSTMLLASQQDELDEGFSKIIFAPKSILGVYTDATLDLTDTELVIDPTARLLVWGTITVPATYEWKTFARIDLKSEAATLFGSTLTTLSTWLQFRTGGEYVTPGDFVIATGGRLNHNQSATSTVNFNVGGDFTIETNAWLDVTAYAKNTSQTACGVNTDTSKGYPTANSGGSHGGRGGPNKDKVDYTTPCVGSIYAPTLHGAAGEKGASGSVRLTVAGTTRVDGFLSAAGQPGDGKASAGGSLILNTKYLVGETTGLITAIGGAAWNNNTPGGGGRIAITLTADDATMDGYLGDLVAFGRARDGWDWYRRRPLQTKTTDGNYKIFSGAGSIYLREKNAAENMGELIYDQFDPYLIDYTYAYSELNKNIADRDFGKVIVRNKAFVKVLDDYKLTTSVFSNASEVTFADTTGITLKGDAEKKAYVYGSTDFAGFTIDPGVDTIYFEAGTTNRIRVTFTAVGTDAGRRIKLRSTVDGEKFYLDVADGPTTSLDYLDIKDSEVVGGTLAAEHSLTDNAVNWSCVNIEPGETIVWNGSSSTSWGDAANWQLADGSPAGRTPVRTDLVTIGRSQQGNYPTLPLTETVLSNLTISAGASLALAEGYGLTVGDFSCAGTLAAVSGETITLEGDVSWPGSFVPMASTVRIVGDGKSVNLGGNAFTVLEFAAATAVSGGFSATTLNVDAGAALTFAKDAEAVSTICHITGESDNHVVLTGEDGYAFTVRGYSEVDYVEVDHADSSAGVTVYANNSADGGSNANWQFADNRKVWKGTSSSAFLTAANWENGDMPGPTDGIVVAADAARVMEITTEGVTIDSLTVLSQGVKFSKPVAVTGAVTLLGGTTTVDQKLTVGGSLTVLSGATMTHTAQGGCSTMLYFFDIDCGGDIYIAEGAVLTATGKGYNCGWGPGYVSNTPGVHGGIGNDRHGNGCGVCYDSIFCPTNCGSGGSQGSAGGGCIVLKAAGTVTINGTVKANGQETGSCDCNNGAGGTVSITAGSIAGTGAVTANGGIASHMTGGGGRIAFVLTRPGADFTGFFADVIAEGGRGTSTKGIQGGCGTVYYQKGDEPYGYGTIKLYSKTDMTLASAANTSKGIYHGLCGLGYPGMDDLKNATVELGANGGIFLFGDIKIGNLTFADNVTATYPARLNFGLASYRGNFRIKINQPRPSGWKKDDFVFGPLQNANYYNGTRLGNIQWKSAGFVLRVR